MTKAAPPFGSLQSHFDWVATHDAGARAVQSGFHTQLRAHFQHHIAEGERVLELGCGAGDLHIRDLPVRYKDRTYGETNISRFRHGALLFRMTWFGLWRLRCYPSVAPSRTPQV